MFHAASLRRSFADVAAAFERANPGVRVRLVPGGSQALARQVSELNMRPDLVAVADAAILDRLLVPKFATWNLEFATNAIVLAFMNHSRFADQLDAENWPEVLLRDNVRLGCVNPALAPLGYHTRLAWQLVARLPGSLNRPPDLAEQLERRCAPGHASSDETELLAQLEGRAIDYAFVYASTAADHHLQTVSLPTDANLSALGLAQHYALVQVALPPDATGAVTTITGGPIVYGLTIPTKAPNPNGAQRLVAFLLGPEGQAIQRKAGFLHTTPARCRNGCGQVPVELARWTKPFASCAAGNSQEAACADK